MKTFNIFHFTVDLFRAHVLNHSSAAERIGNTDLALKICNIKIAKNKRNITSVEKTIDKIKKLIDTKDIKTDDSNATIQIDTKNDDKSQINKSKLNSLISLACKLNSKREELTIKQVSLQSTIDKLNCPNISLLENALLTAPEEHLQTQGLFRTSSSKTNYDGKAANELCSMYDKDKNVEILEAICNDYKKQLRDVVASYSDDKKQALSNALKRSKADSLYTPNANDLPEEVVTCIKICKTFQSHSLKNCMTASNLAIVMGPNVFGNEQVNPPNNATVLEQVRYATKKQTENNKVFEKWIENVQTE